MLRGIGSANRVDFPVFEGEKSSCFDDGGEPIMIGSVMLLKKLEPCQQRVDLGDTVLSLLMLAAQLTAAAGQLSIITFRFFLDLKSLRKLDVERRIELFQFLVVVIGFGNFLVEIANLLIEQFKLHGLAHGLRCFGFGHIQRRIVDAGKNVFKHGRFRRLQIVLPVRTGEVLAWIFDSSINA
jgi:hypothetical protein